MKVERVWCMPHKYTFKMPPVKLLLEAEGVGNQWIDPFCGLYSPAGHRNDADLNVPADAHQDGLEFLSSFRNAQEDLAGVLFDPPYSTEQALRKYKPIQGGTAGRAEYWAKCKDEIARLLPIGGKCISFGWDSCGVGANRGFTIERILLICHGACHNDTIITIDRKTVEKNIS